MRAAGFRLIRYADGFVVLADRRWKVDAAARLVRAILADIGLDVAEAKSDVHRVSDGFGFLGFAFNGKYLAPGPKALARFKDRVRALTRRNAPISLVQMVADLNPVVRGWGGYYWPADATVLFRRLDQWIRMRLRSKVIGRKSTGRDQAKLPIAAFHRLGWSALPKSVEPVSRPHEGTVLDQPDAGEPHVRLE